MFARGAGNDTFATHGRGVVRLRRSGADDGHVAATDRAHRAGPQRGRGEPSYVDALRPGGTGWLSYGLILQAPAIIVGNLTFISTTVTVVVLLLRRQRSWPLLSASLVPLLAVALAVAALTRLPGAVASSLGFCSASRRRSRSWSSQSDGGGPGWCRRCRLRRCSCCWPGRPCG